MRLCRPGNAVFSPLLNFYLIYKLCAACVLEAQKFTTQA